MAQLQSPACLFWDVEIVEASPAEANAEAQAWVMPNFEITPTLVDFYELAARNPAIVVDLEFERYHSRRNIISMAQQVQNLIAFASKRDSPVLVYLVGTPHKLYRQLSKSNFAQWRFFLSAGSLADLLARRGLSSKDPLNSPDVEFTYLSADAVQELDFAQVKAWHDEGARRQAFVLGGLIDRNRHKFMCQRKATRLGLPTRRLPLQPLLLRGCTVLTTYHVGQLLILLNEGEMLTEAVKNIIPQRKQIGTQENNG